MDGSRLRTVLLVDDEENLRTLLHETLDDSLYRIVEAPDGDEALRLAREVRPDIIILDWMMPGRSGIDVVKELRASEEFRSTRILLLTARGREEDRRLALASGVDDYVVKPFSPLQLLHQVEELAVQ